LHAELLGCLAGPEGSGKYGNAEGGPWRNEMFLASLRRCVEVVGEQFLDSIASL